LKNNLVGLALILAATILTPQLPSHARASNARPEPPNVSTGLNDQESVAVTVYNSDIGLIKDIRQLTLPNGLTELRFGEVAAKIMPQTVHIKSLTDPKQLHVLEQNYEYDLLTPRK
jgi:hypothetical protein